jgi:predicted nuclease of predicted toxin-antitoxin system
MSQATDAEIILAARSSGRVVVTLDGDFHAIMATSGQAAPSVIRIRIEGLKSRAIALLVDDIAARFGKELLSGALVTADARAIRARSLPI